MYSVFNTRNVWGSRSALTRLKKAEICRNRIFSQPLQTSLPLLPWKLRPLSATRRGPCPVHSIRGRRRKLRGVGSFILRAMRCKCKCKCTGLARLRGTNNETTIALRTEPFSFVFYRAQNGSCSQRNGLTGKKPTVEMR